LPAIIPLLLALALVIALAKMGGWLSNYLGQPAVLGELVVGLLLGPSVFNVFGQPYFEQAHTVETLHELGELGVIFLMFAAGLEIHLSDLTKTGKPAVLAGVLGVLVPIGLGLVVALPFGYTTNQALFLGIVLAATSVSISAQTLMELGFLRSREGLTLLGAAVVDDVLAIAILSAFVGIATGGGGGVAGVIWILAQMTLFLAGAFFLCMWLLPRAVTWVEDLPISQAVMSLTVVSVLVLAWASEAIGGVAAITGAFIVGVALSGSRLKDEIERGTRTLTYAFFVPIFLVGIGLTANARLLSAGSIGFAVIVSLVAILSKLIGAAAGAKFGGMNWGEATRIGIGMISRGEVGLIVAGVGVSAGVIETDVFTVVVIMVLVTTLVTPPLLRLAFQKKEANNG
jgi:Kef-type K+ transport system membrane component KefB